MDEQEQVSRFVREHGLEAPPAYRLLDLVSELGEVAKEVATSTEYGHHPDEVGIAEDEIGDVLFALFALCSRLDIDASDALATSIAKYEARIEGRGDPGSGA